MNKFYYTYLVYLTNPESKFYGHVYYGKHVTGNLADGYKGSGKIVQSYYEKYPNDYYFKILNFYNSTKELNKAEYDLVHPHLGKPYCLNLREGGEGGNTWLLKSDKEKECLKRKIGDGAKRPCKEETKQKISKANTGKKHPMKDEDKEKN